MDKPGWLLVPSSMVGREGRCSCPPFGVGHHNTSNNTLPPSLPPSLPPFLSAQMNRVGSLILQRVVKKTLPEFLERIQTGYVLWAGEEVV